MVFTGYLFIKININIFIVSSMTTNRYASKVLLLLTIIAVAISLQINQDHEDIHKQHYNFELLSSSSHPLPNGKNHPNSIPSKREKTVQTLLTTTIKKQNKRTIEQKSQKSSTINRNFVTPRPKGWNDEEYGKKTNLQKEGEFFIGTRNKTGQTFRIRVEGGDDTTFFPQPADHYEKDADEYDAIVVGGGLAGTIASLYLTDNNKKILILQKQGHLGGLAAYRKDGKGFTYDRGAAYWTKAFSEQFQIMNHIGISKYFTEYIIPEPIDTYLWNGTLYGGFPHGGIWDDRTLGIEVPAKYKNGSFLPVLPSSFGIFKSQNINDDKLQRIPDQPFQKWKTLELDTITARQWIRQMPEKFHKRISGPGLYAKERRLWARFQEEISKGILKQDDPMSDIIDFLDLYCRSALGTDTNQVSAMGYANFYLSELEPRFTTPFGTGIVINSILERLKAAPNTHIKTNSPVISIKNVKDGAEVRYLHKGKGRIAKAKVVVYSAQLTFAPRMIEGLDVQAPKQAQTMKNLPMAHYSVHNVDVTNHPYRDAYDTWVRHYGYTHLDFTDMILGRWAQLKGYGKGPHDEEREMMKDYSKNPDNKGTNLAIYHSLIELDSTPRDKTNQTYGDYYTAHMAEIAFNRIDQIFGDSGKWRQDFKVNEIVANRWPYSIHITRPGHFSVRSQIMGKSFKNVVFGNNNLGTPSFQEALFRAHCVANKALFRLNPKTFVQESWSKCNYKQ